MAQPPVDQKNLYHHSHPRPHAHSHTQLQLPPQFRNPFDLLFDERTGAINYNYIRPYLPNQLTKPDELADSLVMRRPRRTRTTFTSAQIAELEQHFLQGRYLTSTRLAELSAKLALGTAQVKIWFKNRRRRHKIQSDQQKDPAFSCDGMQVSPTTTNSVKADQHIANTAANLQILNLGSSGGSTPTTLTPSPTPTTPGHSNLENFCDSFNTYYYNGTHASVHGVIHHGQQSQQYPQVISANSAQQFLPPSTGIHQHAIQQQHQYFHHQYDYSNKHLNSQPGVIDILKDDPDFNYNNGFYTNAPPNESNPVELNISSDPLRIVMSPKTKAFHPILSKNEIPRNKIENSTTVETDRLRSKAIQQVVLNSNMNGSKHCTNHVAPMVNNPVNMMDGCNGNFTKFNKVPHGDAHDSNYQCTMDTIIQAYNCHRNNTGSSQFAYCFN